NKKFFKCNNNVTFKKIEKKMDIANIRRDYTLKSLDLDEVADSPLTQFKMWLDEAIIAKVNEANAMNLATLNLKNRPSSRIVLLKGIDHGFLFFTNYESKKGQELSQTPYAALTFFWPELERQVRIEGSVEKSSPEISDTYFLSRPKGSQIGAWVSPQSRVIPHRTFLEDRMLEMTMKLQNEELTRPEHWGGYKVNPYYVEFWQGRASRL